MEYSYILEKNDAFAQLMKESRPLPDAAFVSCVQSTLGGLSEKRWDGVRLLRRRRPVAFAAIVALLLLLCACTAYAAVSLYKNVFGQASEQMREAKEQHEAAYPSIRAEIENDTSEQASEMDMWLDFQATEDAGMLHVMEAISDNAVAVGQQEGAFILSEVCFYTPSGTKDTVMQQLFVGMVAPMQKEMPESIEIAVNGHVKEAWKDNFPLKSSDTERYAIYSIPWMQELPDDMLIMIRTQGDDFCFKYDRQSAQALLPKDEQERQAWLSESARLSEQVGLPLKVGFDKAPVTVMGITADIQDISIDNSALTVMLSLTAAEGSSGSVRFNNITVNIDGMPYRIGENLFVKRVLPDDVDLSSGDSAETCWEIQLPVSPGDLEGKKIGFSVNIKVQELADGWKQEYDEAEKELRCDISFEREQNGQHLH